MDGRKLSTIPVMVGRRSQRDLLDKSLAWRLIRRGLVKHNGSSQVPKMNLGSIHGDTRKCLEAHVPLEFRGKFSWKWSR